MDDHDKQSQPTVEPEPVEESIEEIIGGDVYVEPSKPGISFDQIKHQADTTRWLAIAFIALFATTFVGHYLLSTYLHSSGRVETAEFVSSIFDKWLTGITALTSSVVTYYFTKGK